MVPAQSSIRELIDLKGKKLAVAGGERDVDGAKARGNFLKPTVFAGVRPEMTIAQEEIFGPVLSVMTFQDEEEAVRIAGALRERMQIYEDVLHGAMGLFAASYSVERAEWRSYIASVSIERRFPGIDGVGFIADVPRDNLEEFLRVTRADKTADFRVTEPGTNQDLLILKYIEPEERHRAKLGMNMDLDPEPYQEYVRMQHLAVGCLGMDHRANLFGRLDDSACQIGV